ncbi:MAG: MFS transporter [Phycisphaerae bacterium]|jgi:MFS family permease
MTQNIGQSQKTGFGSFLRALKHKNYRLFFAGQGVSLIGTWMQMVATSWLVYRLTGSAFYLGVISFCDSAPILFGAPIAGVLADRWPRKNIVILTQIFAMLQAFILAAIVFFHLATIPLLIILSLMRGLINTFDMPTRQAFVFEMVDDKNDLPNAIALNSMLFNMARFVGPSIAGFVIAYTGEAACFFINGISFLAVIFALYAMKIVCPPAIRQSGSILGGIKAGLKYSFNFTPIRTILIYTAITSFFATPYLVLMPVFAKVILHGDSRTLGFLMAAIGTGAFIGAVILAKRKSVRGLENVIIIASIIFAAGIIGFSFSKNLWLSFCLIVLPGFGVMVQMASINIILQTIVDDDKRGRVLSLHTMSFIGIVPFGNLLAGFVAEHIGAPKTLLISGILSIATMLMFLRQLPEIRRLIEPIYLKKETIQESINAVSMMETQIKD